MRDPHRAHRQELDAVGFFDGEHGDGAGVIERGEGLRLAAEALEASATSRPSLVSVARYASPIPPAPMAAVTR